MDLNCIAADLNFEKTFVHILDAKCNIKKISNSTEKKFGIDIKYSKPIVFENKKVGKLLLQIDISLKSEEPDSNEDTIKFVIEGEFSSDKSIDDDKFMELLNINGGAALYSIARSKIESISSIVYSEGKVLLPMINIIQYYQEKSKMAES